MTASTATARLPDTSIWAASAAHANTKLAPTTAPP